MRIHHACTRCKYGRITWVLMELSQLYFEQLGSEKEADAVLKSKKKETAEEEVHQCPDCLIVCNDVFGDITQDITQNTPFENLSNMC